MPEKQGKISRGQEDSISRKLENDADHNKYKEHAVGAPVEIRNYAHDSVHPKTLKTFVKFLFTAFAGRFGLMELDYRCSSSHYKNRPSIKLYERSLTPMSSLNDVMACIQPAQVFRRTLGPQLPSLPVPPR